MYRYKSPGGADVDQTLYTIAGRYDVRVTITAGAYSWREYEQSSYMTTRCHQPCVSANTTVFKLRFGAMLGCFERFWAQIPIQQCFVATLVGCLVF